MSARHCFHAGTDWRPRSAPCFASAGFPLQAWYPSWCVYWPPSPHMPSHAPPELQQLGLSSPTWPHFGHRKVASTKPPRGAGASAVGWPGYTGDPSTGASAQRSDSIIGLPLIADLCLPGSLLQEKVPVNIW
eukprot:scaffold75432_cov76-Phaeocystis_antarctica.AAC.2